MRNSTPRAADDGERPPGRMLIQILERARSAVRLSGHHNQNYVVPVKFTSPISEALRLDLRVWDQEDTLLLRLYELPVPRLPVPQVLMSGDEYSVHTYIEGRALDELAPMGHPIDSFYVDQIIDFFQMMSVVPTEELPPSPPDWPEDGDSDGFFRRLVLHSDRTLEKHWDEYGKIFQALGLHEDSLLGYADRPGAMKRRRFTLLHGDLHRQNIIVQPDGRLSFIDWELAMCGDPLYDLATHLHLMRYPPRQRERVISQWDHAVSQVASGPGVARDDLECYLGLKCIHSVLVDVLRSADALREGRKSLKIVAFEVANTLSLAAGPLELWHVPSAEEVSEVFEWWLSHSPNRGAATGSR